MKKRKRNCNEDSFPEFPTYWEDYSNCTYTSTADSYIERLEVKMEKGIRVNRITSY